MKQSIIIGAAAALACAGAAGIFLFRKRKRSNTLYLGGLGYGSKLILNRGTDDRFNGFITGEAGSGRGTHPWDNMNPCPVCGSNSAWFVGKGGAFFEDGSPYKIICLSCGHQSVTSEDWRECKADWNKSRESAESQLINDFEGFLEILPREGIRDKISAISVTRLFDDDVTLLLKDSSGSAVVGFIVFLPRNSRPTLEEYFKIDCDLVSLPPENLGYPPYNIDDLAELIDRCSRRGWTVPEDFADWRECIGGKYGQQNPD